MQMVTYGKPPFWMLHVINPKSPQELQEEVIEVCVRAGSHRASYIGSHPGSLPCSVPHGSLVDVQPIVPGYRQILVSS